MSLINIFYLLMDFLFVCLFVCLLKQIPELKKCLNIKAKEHARNMFKTLYMQKKLVISIMLIF